MEEANYDLYHMINSNGIEKRTPSPLCNHRLGSGEVLYPNLISLLEPLSL